MKVDHPPEITATITTTTTATSGKGASKVALLFSNTPKKLIDLHLTHIYKQS